MQIFRKTPTAADGLPQSGKLKLRLAGFPAQNIVSIDDLLLALDALPNFHLEGLREILYAPDWPLPAPGYPGLATANPKAEFIQRERRIVIVDFDSRGMFYQILFHEIGHHVFFLALGSRIKKQWVTEIYPGSDCATPYGKFSAIEDFAETYACYLRRPEWLLDQLPEKFRFMRDQVFSGRPGTRKERLGGDAPYP